MTPISALLHQAEIRPDEVAFLARDEAWTYRRLATGSERLARVLLARGVRAGDRVALHMPNLPEMALAYYACFRIGAIAAPLNIRMKTAELRTILQRLRPVLYLGEGQLYAQVAPIEPETLPEDARFVVGAIADHRARSWASLVEGVGDDRLPGSPDSAAPAVLLATSGTTGQPKFVVHTPATLAAVIDTFAHLGLGCRETLIHALPMVHGSGLWTFLAGIRFGASTALLERFDPDAALDAIEANRGSFFVGLPFMFSEMLSRQRARPRDVGSLRHARVAGDICPPEMQQAFADVFGVPLRSFWAATEAGLFMHGLQPGPVSRVPPGAEARLVDDAGRVVPRGGVGELLVRGAAVSIGYWAGHGRIEGTLEDGWYHSGDLMRQDDDDELCFVSRKRELIIRGGSNITPVEVEQVLTAHPAVHDAAVIGVPDPVLGQRVAALVQLADDADITILDDVRGSAQVQLADYKVPEWLKAVRAIPRNALGKVERSALSALLSDAAE